MNQQEIRKELNSISVFNTLGLFGILVPFLAWIFAGIGFAKANNLLTTYEDTGDANKDKNIRKLIHNKSMSAITIIFLSIISSVIWFIVLKQ